MRTEAWYVIGPVVAVLGLVAWSFCRAAREVEDQLWGEHVLEGGAASGPRQFTPRAAPPASIRELVDRPADWHLTAEEKLRFRMTLAEIERLPTTEEVGA